MCGNKGKRNERGIWKELGKEKEKINGIVGKRETMKGSKRKGNVEEGKRMVEGEKRKDGKVNVDKMLLW